MKWLIYTFQIKESPEGDWNKNKKFYGNSRQLSFKLKNPRKGTETSSFLETYNFKLDFQIKESPEGDWNSLGTPFLWLYSLNLSN